MTASQTQESSSFRVLGIALVVDERGTGARLVFRYPSQHDNIFFTLPPRALAKIFRPKKTLCNQPMTISLGGTVFCCRAVLMSPEHLKSSSALVMFSVIVALVPSVQTSSIPISGWYELDLPEEFKKSTPEETTHLSASFIAVRQVHVSLARLCRVLEREEKRCRYVEIQAAHLNTIETEFIAMKDKIKNATNPSKVEIGNRRHRRTGSRAPGGSMAGATLSIVTEMAMDEENNHVRKEQVKERQERDQEVMDLMLAAKVEGHQIHGNLARELLQVFHALSRTHKSSASTSSAILTARDCTVFVNRHLAVPIETLATDLYEDSKQTVQPFHTLLFPHVSANSLVESFSSTNNPMKRLLSLTQPSKSLSDIALEAAMPLQSVMELATYLISNGVCIVSHVIRKTSVLACCGGMTRMTDLTLQFSQVFRQLSIHCVVSILTVGCTIEEVVERLSTRDGFDKGLIGGALRELIQEVYDAREQESMQQEQDLVVSTNENEVILDTSTHGGDVEKDKDDDDDDDAPSAVAALEKFVLDMATWLAAHKIVVPMQEYLVSGNFAFDSRSSSMRHDPYLSRLNTADGVPFFFEEGLYKELTQEGGLKGEISTVALGFHFGLDERSINRLRAWGLHSGKLRKITRIPTVGDDDWRSSGQGR